MRSLVGYDWGAAADDDYDDDNDDENDDDDYEDTTKSRLEIKKKNSTKQVWKKLRNRHFKFASEIPALVGKLQVVVELKLSYKLSPKRLFIRTSQISLISENFIKFIDKG